MKELLLNPISIIMILSVFVVYFLIFLHLLNKKNLLILEKISIVLFIFLLSGAYVLYLRYLNPANFSYLYLGVPLTNTQQLFKIAQVFIYTVWIFILRATFRGIFPHTFFLFKDPFVGSLLFLTLLSAAWSDTPIVTLIGSLTLLGIGAFAAHIANKYDWSELSSLLRWAIACVGLLSIPVALFVPSQGRVLGSWNGIFVHKNPFGALMGLGAILWYLSAQNKTQNQKLKITLSLVLVMETFLSTSGGAISILLILFSIVSAYKLLIKLNNRSKYLFILFLIITIVPTAYLAPEIADSGLAILGKDPNLTGRGDFWPQVIEVINKRPLLGYGYMGFWQPWRGNGSPSNIIRLPGGDFIPEQPHNGFLDMGTSLGYVGVTILLLSVLKNFIFAIIALINRKYAESLIPLLILLYLLLRNFSETGLWIPSLDFFLYVILTVRLNLEMKSSWRLLPN
ncbi:O-antigen ligase family protein [Aerosakkonemataceae cyanobacterium BLCC-F50]|uniref:O-antigen ligase family protein n=1 Tax=Floridaenema flaviceps BLCC-F50 TaxID=3153642 RepID=A0ABV4XUS4_9CYAN